MKIPATLNACAEALANLGYHVLTGAERGQVTGTFPVKNLAAFIAVNDEHQSIEATFVLPGHVSEEMSALAFSSALQRHSLGVCRFIIYQGQVLAKASMFASEGLTDGQVQAWWNSSVRDVELWHREASKHKLIKAKGSAAIPDYLQMGSDVTDVFTDDPAADEETTSQVTPLRVARSLAQFTGSMPLVRSTETAQIVETSIADQAVDIEVNDGALRFIIGSALSSKPGLGEALAQTINQLHVLEPAPAAYVLDSGEYLEMYTRGVVDTSMGLDDASLTTVIQKWGPYVHDFNERIFTTLQG